ncbi:MAG: hypothetical protein WC967_07760 [Balneolaceae bacterium]
MNNKQRSEIRFNTQSSHFIARMIELANVGSLGAVKLVSMTN